MSARHKAPRTRRSLRHQAARLAEDLARSEETRIMLMEGRDVLLEQVRLLTARLEHLQRELGSETRTIPVQLVDPSRPISALKPPDTGRIPLQGPDGERLSVQVRGKIRMPRQGVTAGNRPTWATG